MNALKENSPMSDDEIHAHLLESDVREQLRRQKGCLPEDEVAALAEKDHPWFSAPFRMQHVSQCRHCKTLFAEYRAMYKEVRGDEKVTHRAKHFAFKPAFAAFLVLVVLGGAAWTAPKLMGLFRDYQEQLQQQREAILRLENDRRAAEQALAESEALLRKQEQANRVLAAKQTDVSQSLDQQKVQNDQLAEERAEAARTLAEQTAELERIIQRTQKLSARHDALWDYVQVADLFHVSCEANGAADPMGITVGFSPQIEQSGLIDAAMVRFRGPDQEKRDTVFHKVTSPDRLSMTHDYEDAEDGDTFMVTTFLDIGDSLGDARGLDGLELEKKFVVKRLRDRVVVSDYDERGAMPAALSDVSWTKPVPDPLPSSCRVEVSAANETRRLHLLVRPYQSDVAYVTAGAGEVMPGESRSFSILLGEKVYAGEQIELLVVEDDHFAPNQFSIPVSAVPFDRVVLRATVQKEVPEGGEPAPVLADVPEAVFLVPEEDARIQGFEVAVTGAVKAEDLGALFPYVLVQPHAAPGLYWVQNLPDIIRKQNGEQRFSLNAYVGTKKAGMKQGYSLVLLMAEKGVYMAGQELTRLPSEYPVLDVLTLYRE